MRLDNSPAPFRYFHRSVITFVVVQEYFFRTTVMIQKEWKEAFLVMNNAVNVDYHTSIEFQRVDSLWAGDAVNRFSLGRPDAQGGISWNALHTLASGRQAGVLD